MVRLRPEPGQRPIGRFDPRERTVGSALRGWTRDEWVRIPLAGLEMEAHLVLPVGTIGVVVVGTGEGGEEPVDVAFVRAAHAAGLATIILAMPGAGGEVRRLSRRLDAVLDWLHADPRTLHLPTGIFGGNGCSAAALLSASRRTDRVRAAVCRGGRLDLVHEALPWLTIPVLLLVGARDEPMLSVNAEATEAMSCECDLACIPGASHTFAEAGAQEAVARHAVGWFRRNLRRATVPQLALPKPIADGPPS